MFVQNTFPHFGSQKVFTAPCKIFGGKPDTNGPFCVKAKVADPCYRSISYVVCEQTEDSFNSKQLLQLLLSAKNYLEFGVKE